MPKLITLRRGTKDTIPKLQEAEIVYTYDTNEFYIGGRGEVGNTTPTFDGGDLTDTTKGKLIPRHGREADIRYVAPGELFYLEDHKSLAIGLENNTYLILNKAIQQQLEFLAYFKRDKKDLINKNDIGASEITFHHLHKDVRDAINETINDQIEFILAPNSISTSKIIDNSITTPKIINNAITTSKIVDNSITFNKLSPEVRSLLESLQGGARNV